MNHAEHYITLLQYSKSLHRESCLSLEVEMLFEAKTYLCVTLNSSSEIFSSKSTVSAFLAVQRFLNLTGPFLKRKLLSSKITILSTVNRDKLFNKSAECYHLYEAW